MKATSYIEISESAIENNIKFIKDLIGEQVVLSAVVKGNAYGHGIELYCPLAYKYGIRHFTVSDAHEAFTLYHSLEDKDCTIMIMSMVDDHQLEWVIDHGIEFYVFDLDRLRQAIKLSKKLGKPARIHIEVETGMNRTGLEEKDFPALFQLIQANQNHVNIRGLCTHLAGAESIANYKRIKDQQVYFRKVRKYMEKHLGQLPSLHIASSAATVRYPKSRYDMVRVGIMQYGYFPTEEIWVHYINEQTTYQNPLRRIVCWKTKVMEVKTVARGEFIGYGTSFFTNQETRIAIIPVGYSSGYNRSLSNRGKVLIRGKRLDVIGTINMNMMAVDISEASEIEKGDEVVLIGNQGDLEISVSSFSDYSEVINYELLTKLPLHLPRTIVL